jgi:hypothetical protein
MLLSVKRCEANLARRYSFRAATVAALKRRDFLNARRSGAFTDLIDKWIELKMRGSHMQTPAARGSRSWHHG